MTSGAGLREQRREQLLADVQAAALRELARSGPAALSLRAVAREVGIAVSALYRYFASRDDLLTTLVVTAFDDQADAVEEAVAAAGPSAGPLETLRAALLAYRDWSVAHPAPFALLYGAPVADFAAPAGRTLRPGTRVGDLLLGLLAQASAAGAVDAGAQAARARALGPATTDALTSLAERRGHRLPVPVLALGVDLLTRVHGIVVMEVFGQLRPLAPDGRAYLAEVVDVELDRLLVGT